MHKSEAQSLLRCLTVLTAALSFGPSSADIVWKVGDEGPLAPDIRTVLGDDKRTLAFCAEGDYELNGTTWRPVTLKTASVVGESASIFFAGGQFVATTVRDDQLLVFVLKGNEWTQLVSLPSTYQSIVHSEDRLFIFSRYFGGCDPTVSCESETARRLRSISLIDGSIRDEPLLPGCAGFWFVLSGKLHLIVIPPACGGVSSTTRRPDAASNLPFYRLDSGGWTALTPWTLPTWPLLSTPNSLWSIHSGGGAFDYVAQILTSAGLTDPIPLPHDPSGLWPESTPMEWNGRLIVATRERAGNVFQLQNGTFTRMTPASPVTSTQSPGVAVAGRRLFTLAAGWNAFFLDGSAWTETSGMKGTPGAASYLMGSTKTYALRGTGVFLREADGWKRLPPALGEEWTYDACVWMDRPVLYMGYWLDEPLVAFDPNSDSWEGLHIPPKFGSPMLVSGNDLYVSGPAGQMAKRSDRGWSFFAAVPPPGDWTGRATHLREADGNIYMTTGPFPSSSRLSPTYKVEGDHLVPVFTDLDPRIIVLDLAVAEGRLHLLVFDGSRSDALQAVVISPTSTGYETIVTGEDVRWSRLDPLASGSSLASSGDELLLPGLFLARGELRAQRGDFLPSAIDSSGRFASGSLVQFLPGDRSPLLVPSRRVRKNLAAIVDTVGSGGIRYQSTLTLANFSSTLPTIARVFAGAGKEPALEVPLGPGVQTRIEDPIPGFVGPMAVEFEGLTDEREAWAAVRVSSPSDGGTSGTSILATDPGTLPFMSTVLPPAGSSGGRTHIALAASGDGPGETIATIDYREGPGSMYPYASIPNGDFLQVDPRLEVLAAPVGVIAYDGEGRFPQPSRDDLLGYIVTNDAVTNDGTLIPLEAPTTLPGRRTRFLPAVVSITSEFGRYRTELSLGWRSLSDYPPPQLSFRVTYRAIEGSWSFPISLDSGRIRDVPDAGAWLAANGVPVDPSNFVGTLTFESDRPEGAADLLVTAVVQSRGATVSGDYGVSVPLFNEAQWASTEAIVSGLREDGAFRSNIALANPEPDGGQSATLSVSLRRASEGTTMETLPPVSLTPGQRVQLNRPGISHSASSDFYAVISKTSGLGRFVAYGVVNDNVTGDGTLLPMTSVH
jgi:hypothetical protein